MVGAGGGICGFVMRSRRFGKRWCVCCERGGFALGEREFEVERGTVHSPLGWQH